MQIKAAVFDFDGTIADSMPFWADFASKFVTHLGKTPRDGLNTLVNAMSVQEAEVYLQKEYFPEMALDEIIRATDTYVMAHYEKGFNEKAGAGEFIRAAYKKGVKMAVATATDRQPISKALDALGLLQYFECIVTCTDAGVGKSSSPRVFDMALDKLGVKKDEAVIFEDSFYAAKTAKAANYTVYGLYDNFSANKKEEMIEICDKYFGDFHKAKSELL